jgi:uncharacterized protein involved in oxidation of intracellular sulfur
MKILFVLNDPPYGTERTYNGLRLAMNLPRQHEETEVTVFLMGDAVAAAKRGQTTPNGYYNLERMIAGVVKHKGQVLLCGTCMDARALKDDEIVEWARRSTLDELTEATVAADRVLVF